ncbi:MAG: disaggregatase related repeat-containing protein [Methanosarcina sp.]
MKTLKSYLTVFVLAFLCLTLSSPAASASNIVIDDDAKPAISGLYLTSDYTDDAACIQAALDNSKSGDTITIREGDYYIKKQIYQKGKNLNIIGEGEVTFHIQTAESCENGISFTGSTVTNKALSADAKNGSSQIILTDASQVRQNDLIKIWKNVQWCPLDYPDQMTGEIYAVQSVNGNVVTLNQPLLRDYKLYETVQTEVYRPIEMHIQNIRLEDTGATMRHHGLVMQYCKDSSVTNSWLNNSGFGAICLYSCFNMSVNNNEIYNSLRPGSGYGVNVASGTAFVNIEHNHIENCRHAITGNSAERKSLNRDVFIADNTLIGANIGGSDVVDAHPLTINYIVTKNKIYPQLPYFFAFLDGTQYSEFSENEVYGGYGAVVRRGSVNDGVHVIRDNIMDGIAGNMYQGGKNGIGDTLIITNNVQNGGRFGVYFPHQESFRNIIISGNTFSNLLNKGVYQQFLIDRVNLKISDNTFENIRQEGIYLDGNSYTNGDVKIQNNNLINVYASSPGSEITIKNIQGASVSGNQISEEGASVRTVDKTTVTEIVTETAAEQEVEADNLSLTEETATSIVIDNRLREASPETVYQEKVYVDIGGRPGIGRYRDLLLFDLNDYTDDGNVSNATLYLYWYYPDGQERPEDSVVEIYRPAAAWNPEKVTWNSRDDGVLWTQPGGDWFDVNNVSHGNIPYATITLNGSDIPDNRYYEFNVTDLVKEYVSGEYENTGFLIKTRKENADYVAFYSSEIEDENQRPMLNIEEKAVA